MRQASAKMSLPMTRCLCAAIALVASVAAPARGQDAPSASTGRALFATFCANCHDGAADSRAPAPHELPRAPEAILESLINGAMRVQGSRLGGAERRAIAEYITGKTLGGDGTGAAAGRSTAESPLQILPSGTMWNGWAPTITNPPLQSAAQAGLT